MSQLPFQNLISLQTPPIGPSSLQTLHCDPTTSDIMPPPKEVSDDAKATHKDSNPDIVTFTKNYCYYCKKKKGKCICDGTPFKKSTPGSETLPKEQKTTTTDAPSSSTKPAMQSEDDNLHSQTGSTLEG